MSEKTILHKCFVHKSDYYSLRSYYMYKQKPERTKITAYILLISLILLVISETSFAMPFFKAIGLLGILIIAGIYSWISIDARHLDKYSKGFVNKNQEVNLSNSGFTVKWTGFEQSEYSWNDIDHVVESDSHFYIFMDQYFAIILPKIELKEYQETELHALFERYTELVSDTSGWKSQKI